MMGERSIEADVQWTGNVFLSLIIDGLSYELVAAQDSDTAAPPAQAPARPTCL